MTTLRPGAGGDVPCTTIAELPPALLQVLLAARPPGRAAVRRARKALARVAVDWDAVGAAAERQEIAALCHVRLADLGVAGELPESVRYAWEANQSHARLQCALQLSDALRVTRRLRERGVPHAFIKGAALRQWVYRPRWARLSCDTDLLVAPGDVETVRATLLELGFAQASRSPDFRNFRVATPDEIRELEARHHELVQFARTLELANAPDWLLGPHFRRPSPFTFDQLESGPVLYSVIDVHWALHFTFQDEEPLREVWMIPAGTGGEELPVLTVEWNLLITAFKLYFESFDHPGWGLHLLADLAALLRRHAREVNWVWLLDMVERYRVQAAAFYTFSAAERLAGVPLVPRELMGLWAMRERDGDDPDRNLDFGDFMPWVLNRRAPASLLPPLRSRARA